MKKIIARKYRFILVLSILAGLLLGLKLIIPTPLPKLTKINPTDQATNVSLDTEIGLEFDQDIVSQSWQIIVSPQLQTNYKTNKNLLIITPQENLEPSTIYKFEVKNPQYPHLSIFFGFTTTTGSDIKTTPTQEGIRRYYEELDQLTYEGMPLFDYIPFEAENFKADYIAPLKLEIILKEDAPSVRQEVFDWMKLRGVEPESHQFVWKLEE